MDLLGWIVHQGQVMVTIEWCQLIGCARYVTVSILPEGHHAFRFSFFLLPLLCEVFVIFGKFPLASVSGLCLLNLLSLVLLFISPHSYLNLHHIFISCQYDVWVSVNKLLYLLTCN